MMLMSSCYTPNKALKDLKKANNKYPDIASNFLRLKYPCIFSKDTIVINDTSYEFIEIQCPEDTKIDTVSILNNPKVDKSRPYKIFKVYSPIKTKIIKVEDSSKIFNLSEELLQCLVDKKELSSKLDKKKRYSNYFLFGLILSVILNALLIYKK
jgi:hypothetical protein